MQISKLDCKYTNKKIREQYTHAYIWLLKILDDWNIISHFMKIDITGTDNSDYHSYFFKPTKII